MFKANAAGSQRLLTRAETGVFSADLSIFGTADRQGRYMYKNQLTRCSFRCLQHKHQKAWWSSLFQVGVNRA